MVLILTALAIIAALGGLATGGYFLFKDDPRFRGLFGAVPIAGTTISESTLLFMFKENEKMSAFFRMQNIVQVALIVGFFIVCYICIRAVFKRRK